MQGADCLIFIDSSAAEGTLLSAYSSSPFLTSIAGAFWKEVGRLGAAAWITRVPSRLNLADPISRDDLGMARAQGWTEKPAVIPKLGPWAAIIAEGHRREGPANTSQALAKRHRRQIMGAS